MKRRNPHRRARIPRKRSLAFRGAADVRGYGGFEPSPGLLLGGAAVLAFLFMNRKDIVSTGTSIATNIIAAAKAGIGQAFDFTKAAAFKAALPSGVARWSTQILSAAQRYGVDPWVLAGIMYVETHGGDAPGYEPKGSAAGTGDFIPRAPSGTTPPSGWVTSGWAKYANPATGLPPDGKGWGRGLMQIDYGAHNAWVTTSAWYDAQTNINKGAELLRANLDFFKKSVAPGTRVTVEAWRVLRGMGYGIEPWKDKYGVPVPPPNSVIVRNAKGEVTGYSVLDPRPITGALLYPAAIVAHNTGPGGVLQALALGLPVEAPSTRQNYFTKFMERVGTWLAKFS